MNKKEELQRLNTDIAIVKKICKKCGKHGSEECKNCRVSVMGESLLVRRELLKVENDREEN